MFLRNATCGRWLIRFKIRNNFHIKIHFKRSDYASCSLLNYKNIDHFETSEMISSLVGWCNWLWELFFFIFPFKKNAGVKLFWELVHEVRPKICVWVLSGPTSIAAEGNGPEAPPDDTAVTTVCRNRRPPQSQDVVSEGRALVTTAS